MGEYRFRIPETWDLQSRQAGAIHVVGLDGIPWPCRLHREEDTLLVSRNRDESGRIYVTLPFDERGEFLVCTGTLPERDEPYDLLLELARGTLNRLRNQTSIWEEGGLEISDQIREQTKLAIEHLGAAIMTEDAPSRDERSRQSIHVAFDSLFELAKSFGKQIAKFRVENSTDFARFWFAQPVASGAQFEASVQATGFDLLSVGPENLDSPLFDDPGGVGKRIIAGPFLDASAGGMPAAIQSLGDVAERRSAVLASFRDQLSRLPASTSLIHLASGLNGLGHRHLGYPQQLQLVGDMIRLAEEMGNGLPTMISFDFPWAERLASSVGGVHPIQIADSLLRQGHKVSLLGLDINLDYWPGSVIRDPLQWIDLLDVWAQMGIPMVICLRVPSGDLTPHADAPERLCSQVRSKQNDEQRIEFLETIIPLLIARPAVQGIIFRQWDEASDPRFPGAGMVDRDGNLKPMWERIGQLRQQVMGD